MMCTVSKLLKLSLGRRLSSTWDKVHSLLKIMSLPPHERLSHSPQQLMTCPQEPLTPVTANASMQIPTPVIPLLFSPLPYDSPPPPAIQYTEDHCQYYQRRYPKPDPKSYRELGLAVQLTVTAEASYSRTSALGAAAASAFR